jgi:GrpB-like predicted nucleotidyltransferase (UPF0157 family)
MTDWRSSTRENKSYRLEPYNPEWPSDFLALQESISPLFGDNLIDIHHIGSTAVPGMLAKPQIDVCAVVKDLSKVTATRDRFVNLGFRALGDYVGQQEEYFTYVDEYQETRNHVHTLQEGNPEIHGYLAFRDYLRAFPAARARYISVKTGLMGQFGEHDYNSYTWGKPDRIADLKANALAWYIGKSALSG